MWIDPVFREVELPMARSMHRERIDYIQPATQNGEGPCLLRVQEGKSRLRVEATHGGGVDEFEQDDLHHLPHPDAPADTRGGRGELPAARDVHVEPEISFVVRK